MKRAVKELGQLASGEYVHDRPRSHLHGPVIEVIEEALSKLWSNGREIIAEHVDLGRVIGQRTCVETTEKDEIAHAQRPNRKGLTRFVKGRDPEDCSLVTLVLKRDAEYNYYVCLSAYIGSYSEPEPWDKHATSKSDDFWRNHALIWGTEEVVGGTD